ncbi:protein of unknown function [Bradyrhizobium vignae]|uniref:Uncharacterized protein n=1 Tax=Bradyrhizobium vignae TaxID=1549949 RepID=A0A2U3QAS5_9BRAD|nr:protein of unknown function [Bradyrhizobium vignae]
MHGQSLPRAGECPEQESGRRSLAAVDSQSKPQKEDNRDVALPALDLSDVSLRNARPAGELPTRHAAMHARAAHTVAEFEQEFGLGAWRLSIPTGQRFARELDDLFQHFFVLSSRT